MANLNRALSIEEQGTSPSSDRKLKQASKWQARHYPLSLDALEKRNLLQKKEDLNDVSHL
jgi:hypothetical protein